jgi:glyoxylase-like metal-dependent hydrolase (beta-lactamase superfamily II)
VGPAGSAWLEVGGRVFARRYRFYDQQIGAILTEDGPVVIDTRSSPSQAREILDELRLLTCLPVAAVIATHHHYDHTFGNATFRPAPIWGHVRCAEAMLRWTLADLAETADEVAEVDPDVAAEIRAGIAIDPPDRTFGDDGAELDIGGRRIHLRYAGRGHTDNDVVVVVPDADVVFAGDLLEDGAPPYVGDGYPLDWPATLVAVRELVSGAVVPGHGAVGDVAFVDRVLADVTAIADLARQVAAGTRDLRDAVAAAPYPVGAATAAIERGVAQALGKLDPA